MIKPIITTMFVAACSPAYAAGELQMVFGLGTVAIAKNDKVQHFGAGMAAAGLTRKLGGTFWQSCGAALTIGILKEAYDSTGRGTVDAGDALATVAGCLWFERKF